MAGIGWKLQRLIDRNTLAGTVGAYLTGVAVTSAPWLLTTAVLVILRLSLKGRAGEYVEVERIITAVYALTVVLAAPVHVVISRHASDRVYDRQLERIAAPLRRALGFLMFASAVCGAALMWAIGESGQLAVIGVALCAVVSAQWLLLSVGGGLSAPLDVLRAFGLGAAASIFGALVLDRAVGLGASGHLLGFALGQLLGMLLLFGVTFRALPTESDESERISPIFLEYRMLALGALCYHAAIWSDKVAMLLVGGKEVATQASATGALAWFFVIPGFAWMYVEIETRFYRSFRAFYDSLRAGASLTELQQGSALLAREAGQVLAGAARVQAAVTLIAILAAPRILGLAGIPLENVALFRYLVVGAGLQVVAMLAILLLYYFDLQREALSVSVVLMVGCFAFTASALLLGLNPGLGYLAGCLVTLSVGLYRVRSGLSGLLLATFQGQAFGTGT